MEKYKKLIIWMLLFIMTPTLAVSANSAEPPGLTVVVFLPPNDLSLSIQFADGNTADARKLQKEQKAWEAYFRFFYDEMFSDTLLKGSTLIINSSKKSFEIFLPGETFTLYNNLIVLDFKNETVKEGTNPIRSVLLISMRVILTLIIEGLVLFLFKYRKKSSWIIFVIVNLLTQTGLNVTLSGPGTNLNFSYWFYGLIFLEIIIFAVEAVAYMFTLKEHTKKRAVLYAFTANYASFTLGCLLLSYFPV